MTLFHGKKFNSLFANSSLGTFPSFAFFTVAKCFEAVYGVQAAVLGAELRVLQPPFWVPDSGRAGQEPPFWKNSRAGG